MGHNYGTDLSVAVTQVLQGQFILLYFGVTTHHNRSSRNELHDETVCRWRRL